MPPINVTIHLASAEPNEIHDGNHMHSLLDADRSRSLGPEWGKMIANGVVTVLRQYLEISGDVLTKHVTTMFLLFRPARSGS